jgi:hypothetical protein
MIEPGTVIKPIITSRRLIKDDNKTNAQLSNRMV